MSKTERVNRRELVALAGASALLLLFLWPTLHMPLLGDDMYNAYIDGWLGYERLTLGQALTEMYRELILGNGRFYPVYPLLLLSEFHFFHSVIAIKALVLIAILINALTLYALLRSIAPAVALPSLVLLPASLQIRFFHDAIIQFALHLQIALEFVLLGGLGLVAYARSGRHAWLWLGAAAYALGCMTYEAAYPFVLVYAFLAWRLCDPRRRVLAIVAFTLPPLLCSALVLAIRSGFPVAPNSLYAIALNPAVAPTLLRQETGALPLFYYAMNPSGFFAPLTTLWHSSAMLWVVGAAAAVAAALALRARRPAEGELAIAFGFGALAALGPGSPVALSPHWQNELRLGLAYTPVYFQDFGIAVLLGLLAVAIRRLGPEPIGAFVAAVAAAFVIGTAYGANQATLDHYRLAFWGRGTMPRAAAAGLLREIPANARLYLDDSYPPLTIFEQRFEPWWNARYFLFAYTDKRLNAQPLASLPARVSGNAFLVRGSAVGVSGGVALAANVDRIADLPPPLERTALTDRATRYAETNSGDGALAMWRSSCGAIPVDNVLAGTRSGLLLKYDSSFYEEEADGSNHWRWARRPATVIVDNPTDRTRTALLRFVVRPAGPAKHVSVAAPRLDVHAPPGGGDLPVSVQVVLRPGERQGVHISSDGGFAPQPPAGGRRLLFEVRDATLSESDCR